MVLGSHIRTNGGGKKLNTALETKRSNITIMLFNKTLK